MANFSARILATAARLPDQPAIEFIGTDGMSVTSYGALCDEARRTSTWLRNQRFRAGDRAALAGDNSAAWIAAYLGILWLGGVAVPLDTAYSADQIRTILASSGARILFASARYLDRARAARETLGTGGPTLVLLGEPSDATTLDDLHRIPTPTPPDAVDGPIDPGASAPAVMLYTSGTTADPKGVVLTHANLEAERTSVLAVIDASERDAVLGVLPLFHALAQMANLLLPLSVGARVVFLQSVNSTSLLDALDQRAITIFACVPQFFYLIHERVTGEVARGSWLRRIVFRALLALNGRLRRQLGWNPGRRWFGQIHRRLGPSMRFLITGGSRFDPGIGYDLYRLGFTILNAYGLTETSGAATMQRRGDTFTASVGPPLPGVEVRIARPRTLAPEDGESPDGEILLRGAIVMQGYFERPDATREALDAEGWLHTGDLGRVDGAGRLYITGRQKEIIVLASGKNLYPEEIEAHYRQSPFIKELCVLGLTRPGEPAAERLHAVLVPNEDTLRARGIVNVGDIMRFEVETWSASLPAHKRILSYDLVTEALPRTTTGKLKRHLIERATRQRAAESAAAGTRPLSADEQAWLDDPRHRPLVQTISTRLGDRPARPDANLELDLGLDSMERVELLTVLERRTGRAVRPEVRAVIFTLRQLVDAVLAGDPRTGVTPSADSPEPPWAALLAQPADETLVREFRKAKFGTALAFFVIIRTAIRCARLFLRIRISGRAQLPARGPFLLTPNHQTYLDGFLLAGVLPYRTLRNLFFVGAAEFFESPARRWFARRINLAPIDPDTNLVGAMQAGAAGLRLGKVLILFPEGERTIDGEIKRFRKGAAILASEVKAPIVPVAIDGLFPLWPRGRAFQWGALRWPRRTITVTFGAPIEVGSDGDVEATRRLADAVRAAWEAHRA